MRSRKWRSFGVVSTFVFVVCGRPAAAAPVIQGILNAASYIQPGLPNAPLSPGSVFVIKGSGLGPANTAVAAAPFQTTSLGGTSVAITAGGNTVNAPLYYTSDGQIAALLPSNTPTGTATFTVTYNGQPSSPAGHGVAARVFGILTLDSTGQGPALVTFPDFTLVSAAKGANCGAPQTPCGAANPGDTLILWGTGLGAVSGNETSGAGLGQDMPDIPLTVRLGGVEAPVTYRGRSGCCVGEDQVVFTVPPNVPTGCAVPLVVQIASVSSNTTLLPIATGSRSCIATDPAINAQGLAGIGNSFTVGAPELDHVRNDSGSGYVDKAQFNFLRVSGIPSGFQPFLASFLDQQPNGTCSVNSGRTPSDIFFSSLTLAPLDAGSAFTVTGPKGSLTVTAGVGDAPVLSAAGSFLLPGDYTITGGPGKDVGTFTAHISIPASATLTSPASSTNLTVTRSQGMTVTWNPNGSTGRVEIVLASFLNQNTGVQAVCEAAASAGTFTIPPYVLLALPPGNGTNFDFQPGAPASSGSFSANGLDAGIIQTFIDGTRFSGFQLN